MGDRLIELGNYGFDFCGTQLFRRCLQGLDFACELGVCLCHGHLEWICWNAESMRVGDDTNDFAFALTRICRCFETQVDSAETYRMDPISRVFMNRFGPRLSSGSISTAFTDTMKLRCLIESPSYTEGEEAMGRAVRGRCTTSRTRTFMPYPIDMQLDLPPAATHLL